MSKSRKIWESVEAEETSGEEQWIVSYADMVTLLFGFFVILYSFSTLDDKKFSQMSETLAEAFKAPDEPIKKTTNNAVESTESRQIRALHFVVSMLNLGGDMDSAISKIEAAAANKTSAADRQKELEGPLSLLKKELGSTSTKAMPNIIEVVLPSEVMFTIGRSDLQPGAMASINQIAEAIRKISSVEHIERIEVIGHTDSVQPSETSYYKDNFALSSARAGSVARALMAAGVRKDLVSVRGMADLQPFDANNPKAAVNRRVQVVIHRGASRD